MTGITISMMEIITQSFATILTMIRSMPFSPASKLSPCSFAFLWSSHFLYTNSLLSRLKIVNASRSSVVISSMITSICPITFLTYWYQWRLQKCRVMSWECSYSLLAIFLQPFFWHRLGGVFFIELNPFFFLGFFLLSSSACSALDDFHRRLDFEKLHI